LRDYLARNGEQGAFVESAPFDQRLRKRSVIGGSSIMKAWCAAVAGLALTSTVTALLAATSPAADETAQRPDADAGMPPAGRRASRRSGQVSG
jgi:hypothetical protein